MRDPALRLLPDLGAGRLVVRLGVDGVVVLVGEDGPRRRGHDGLRLLDVVLGVVGGHRGRHHDHLRPVGAQEADLLPRHLVGDREDAAVALERSRDREAHPGVPARPLDDHASRLQGPAPLRRLDDGEADPVLHRAARVEILGLSVDGSANPPGDPMQPHQGRPAHRLQDVFEGLRVARAGHG